MAAVDEDVSGLLDDAVHLVDFTSSRSWVNPVMGNLIDCLDTHLLAKRIVSGLEPDFTMRLINIPALEQLRVTLADLISRHQAAGTTRRDIKPEQMASGMVTIVISLLIANVQTGGSSFGRVSADVEAVLDAATRPAD